MGRRTIGSHSRQGGSEVKKAAGADYSTVTEQPGQFASRDQMAMLVTRYAWAAEHAMGKDVLEVACGAGLGLSWLARAARSVEAGDVDESNCRLAEAAYRDSHDIRIRCMDAAELPFRDASFDLVLLFEAVYYFPDAERCFFEAHRVLRPGGLLLISSANREWSGFHPSPMSTRYLSAAELGEALADCGFTAWLSGAFPEPRDWAAPIRRVAISCGLIPRTMRRKALLKRLFQGPLSRIPERLQPGPSRLEALVPLDHGPDLTRCRVLYAEARR
jgi:SAM-dependent methyltransferase